MLAQQIYDLIQPFVAQEFIVPRTVLEIEQNSSEFITIVNDDNEVIACCGLKEHTDVSEIYCLAIDVRYHGTGLAQQLLSKIERATDNTLVAMSKYQGEWFIKQGFTYGSINDLPSSVNYNDIRKPKIFIKHR